MALSILRRPAPGRDLVEIWAYIADTTEPAADSLLDRIDNALAMLAENPMAGRARTEIDTGVRSFPVGNDIVYQSGMPLGRITIPL